MLHGDPGAAAARRAAAKRGAGALPTLLHALLLILDADAPNATSRGDWAEQRARAIVASAGAVGVDHPYLWKEVTSLMTLAEVEGLTKPSERLVLARRAAHLAPADPLAAFGLGTALVATAEEHVIERSDVSEAKGLCAEAVPQLARARRVRGKEIRRERKAFLRAAKAGATDPTRVWPIPGAGRQGV